MEQGWRWALVVAGMVGVVILDSCKHGKCEGGGTSQHGSDESHNAGANCMSCHHPDAGEAPCWQLAGTAYRPDGNTPLANATLLLFSRPLGQGTLLRAIDYDALGNVYTGDPIQFGVGIFPAVLPSEGDTAFMEESIHDGACNRCHGVTTAVVTAP